MIAEPIEQTQAEWQSNPPPQCTAEPDKNMQADGSEASEDSGLDKLEVRCKIKALIVGIRESQPQSRWQPLMENIN